VSSIGSVQGRALPSAPAALSSAWTHGSRPAFLGSASALASTSSGAVRASPARGGASITTAMAGSEQWVMVNSIAGKMGHAVASSSVAAGLNLIPYSLAVSEYDGQKMAIEGVAVELVGPQRRDAVMKDVMAKYPGLVVVDYTSPSAVNENGEYYCSLGLPFVMGTTGGDRPKLMETVKDAGVYAVIAPQMGKQVVAFQAAMEIMAEKFPGAFAGYTLTVTESHQKTKADTSGTAKAIVASFQGMGLDFDVDEIEKVRDEDAMVERMGVPEAHLNGHAYHTYHLASPDGTVNFEFQHNVCGRSIYAEGTVDAVLFLAKMISKNTDKKLYDMVDVLGEGSMR